ncbi:MAG: DUF4430 domain-containing protein [Clostridia bacterium]|nr:DUF4430 domain-containing protein [Clostridia bacterium]
MKKKILSLLTLLSIFTLIFSVAACQRNNDAQNITEASVIESSLSPASSEETPKSETQVRTAAPHKSELNSTGRTTAETKETPETEEPTAYLKNTTQAKDVTYATADRSAVRPTVTTASNITTGGRGSRPQRESRAKATSAASGTSYSSASAVSSTTGGYRTGREVPAVYETETSSFTTTTQTTTTERKTEYVNVRIDCKNAVDYGVEGLPSDGVILDTKVELQDGDTALDVLKRAAQENNIEIKIKGGNYVSSINGLKERQCGGNSGWLYSVNGEYPMTSSSAKPVRANDTVAFTYTVNYGDVIAI